MAAVVRPDLTKDNNRGRMVMHGLIFATKLEGKTRRLKTIATVTVAALLVAGCGGPKMRTSGNPKQQGQPKRFSSSGRGPSGR